VAWDIWNTCKVVQPEDIDPKLHDEEANNWFMCPVCRTDFFPGELVSRMPVIDGQVFVAWRSSLLHRAECWNRMKVILGFLLGVQITKVIYMVFL